MGVIGEEGLNTIISERPAKKMNFMGCLLVIKCGDCFFVFRFRI